MWARIWLVLSSHFVSAGSHHDEKVATYAIDSLRQLGMKYLERAELANFTFQNDILKPFVALMRTSKSESTRRLIVDSVVQVEFIFSLIFLFGAKSFPFDFSLLFDSLTVYQLWFNKFSLSIPCL